MVERARLKAISLLRADHHPADRGHALQFLMPPIRRAVERVKVFFECYIMAQNDELQPVRVGGLLQFTTNAFHQAELMARIETRRDVIKDHKAGRTLMLDGGGEKDRCSNGISIALGEDSARANVLQPMKICKQQLDLLRGLGSRQRRLHIWTTSDQAFEEVLIFGFDFRDALGRERCFSASEGVSSLSNEGAPASANL